MLSDNSFGLEFLRRLHEYRTPILDCFFKALNFFDSNEFFLILIPAVWIGYNWKMGLRLFYILALSSFFNFFLKSIFQRPRPFQIEPTLEVIKVGGYSFPSGAAQTAVLLAGIIAIYWKNPWRWVVASTFFILLSLSRMYLGVHFPIDILFGWIVGAFLLFLFVYARPPLEKFLQKLSLLKIATVSILIPLLFLISNHSHPMVRLISIAIGIGIGLYFFLRYKLALPLPKSFFEFFLRSLIGILGAFGIAALVALLPSKKSLLLFSLPSLLLGVWISVLATLVCRFALRRFFKG